MSRQNVRRLKKKKRRDARKQRAEAAREDRAHIRAVAEAFERGELIISSEFIARVVAPVGSPMREVYDRRIADGLTPGEALAELHERPELFEGMLAGMDAARAAIDEAAE